MSCMHALLSVNPKQAERTSLAVSSHNHARLKVGDGFRVSFVFCLWKSSETGSEPANSTVLYSEYKYNLRVVGEIEIVLSRPRGFSAFPIDAFGLSAER
jgi:hypothetical protein